MEQQPTIGQSQNYTGIDTYQGVASYDCVADQQVLAHYGAGKHDRVFYVGRPPYRHAMLDYDRTVCTDGRMHVAMIAQEAVPTQKATEANARHVPVTPPDSPFPPMQCQVRMLMSEDVLNHDARSQ